MLYVTYVCPLPGPLGPCSAAAARRGFDPRQLLTAAVGDLKLSLVPLYFLPCLVGEDWNILLLRGGRRGHDPCHSIPANIGQLQRTKRAFLSPLVEMKLSPI
jgi:hypothetical protein